MELDNYINAFDSNNDDVQKTKIYAIIPQIVLNTIKQDIEREKTLLSKVWWN